MNFSFYFRDFLQHCQRRLFSVESLKHVFRAFGYLSWIDLSPFGIECVRVKERAIETEREGEWDREPDMTLNSNVNTHKIIYCVPSTSSRLFLLLLVLFSSKETNTLDELLQISVLDISISQFLHNSKT